MVFSQNPESIENRFDPDEESLRPVHMVEIVGELQDRLKQREIDAYKLTHFELERIVEAFEEPTLRALDTHWKNLVNYHSWLESYLERHDDEEFLRIPTPIEPVTTGNLFEDSIDYFASALAIYADAHDIAMQGKFNDVILTVKPGDSPKQIIEDYWRGMDEFKAKYATAEKE